MDENHQDKTESKTLATADVRWVFNKRSKLYLSKTKKRTGFEDKTRWDWLQLIFQAITAIGIPLSIIALLIGVWQFNVQQQADREKAVEQQQLTLQQEESAQQQALEQQRQTTLDTYLDRMSDLLLLDHLQSSKSGDVVRALAQALTYTAVRNLDGNRKGTLVRFLWNAGLINGQQPIISLSGASLDGVNMPDADLSGANLSGTFLNGANLGGAFLCDADLSGKKVCADLRGAYLEGADLSSAHGACLSLGGDKLVCADLRGTYLCGNDVEVKTACADLRGASLQGADLSGAHGACVNLYGGKTACADLRGAYLEGTKMNNITGLSETLLQGAYYNTKTAQITDLLGNLFTIGPTQWPEGFDPVSAGLKCVDCKTHAYRVKRLAFSLFMR